MLNGDGLSVFLLRAGVRQEYLLSQYSFNTIWESSQLNKATRRNKRHPYWKEKNKTGFTHRLCSSLSRNLMQPAK